MGNGVTSRRSSEFDDEYDGYVMVDARAVILDLPEEASAGSVRPLRGRPLRSEGEAGFDQAAWGAMLGARRRAVVADASVETVSFWQRLGRRLGAWSGAPGERGR